jgi:copper chaperone CopZ
MCGHRVIAAGSVKLSCARTVGRTLTRVPGVTSAAVDFELGAAIVNGIAETPSLVAAVEAAAYGTSVADGKCDERRE